MLPIIYLLVFAFLIAVSIGSFLNVVISRAFTRESIVLPPSKCPKCREKIKWYDNIPILSFFFLKGKCRSCKEPISMQYPIVELVTGIMFIIIVLKYGVTLTTMFLLVIAALSIVIAATDIREKVVFDAHTITFIIVAVIYNLMNGTVVHSLIGLAVGAAIMEIISRLGYLFVKKRAFGEGDTFIAAGIGALLGAKMFILVLALAVLAQVLFILPSFLRRMWRNNEQNLVIAIISFLCITIFYKLLGHFIALNIIVQLVFVVVIVCLGLYSCIKLTKITKASTELTYLPFGPSLLIMMFVALFFGNPILKAISILIF